MSLHFDSAQLLYEYKPNQQVKEFTVKLADHIVYPLIEKAITVVEGLGREYHHPVPSMAAMNARRTRMEACKQQDPHIHLIMDAPGRMPREATCQEYEVFVSNISGHPEHDPVCQAMPEKCHRNDYACFKTGDRVGPPVREHPEEDEWAGAN